MNNLELADKLQDEASNNYGDLCGMLWDAGAALHNLHTENMALRCTEMALRDINAELDHQLELGKDVVRGDMKLLAERDMAIAELERKLEESANGASALAKKWWARHCESNRHMETTREAHEDFCQLERAIRVAMQKGQS